MTASDVARRAGVSQATVSFALRGEAGVSDEVAERIRKLAQAMNYYPNAAGQLLQSRRNGRVGQLGVIVAAADSVSALASISIRLCLGQFVDYCSKRQMRYVIEFHPPMQDEADFVPPHHAAAGACDGSLILGDVGDHVRQWLDRKVSYPWVSVYEPAEYCVLPQSDVGMIDAVRQLVELGHRRIACSVGPLRYLTHRLRHEGFERAIKLFDLEVQPGWLDCWDTSISLSDHMYQWSSRILSDRLRPTAIICSGGAQPILHRATELGLAVPRDLSLLAWAPLSAARETYPHLSVVDLDMATVMKHAMELLLARIDGRSVESRTRWVPPQLFQGSSTGPAPAEPRVSGRTDSISYSNGDEDEATANPRVHIG